MEDVQIALMAKHYGKPVWVDFDDDLFSIPEENHVHPLYASKATRDNVAQAAANADIVTVSTEFLKTQIELHSGSKNVQVIPNAHNDYVYSMNRSLYPRDYRVVMWRGSDTHLGDLSRYSEDLIKAIRTHTEWKWVFVGWNPYFITKYLRKDNFTYFPPTSIHRYYESLMHIQPDLHIVPLADCTFNRSKSNCAWLEGTWAGAAVLGPDFDEWRKPGLSTYVDARGITEEFDRMFGLSHKKLQQHRKYSVEYIKENLLLSKVNLKRKKILKDLMKT